MPFANCCGRIGTAQYRARAAAVRNSAVFEVPEILAEIFQRKDRARLPLLAAEPASEARWRAS